jgi:hypothetical protein
MPIAPPIWHVSETVQLTAGLLFTAGLVLTLIYATRTATRDRDIYPYCLIAAGGLICFGEPFVDVLGHCMFPVQDVVPYIDTFGRQIPLYMAPVYFFYFGASFVWTFNALSRGVTTRQWWKRYAGLAAFGLCFEPIPIALGWWTYYGDNQPIRFINVPMWWGFANTAADIVTAAMLFHLVRRLGLTGRRSLILVPVMPVAFMGVHTMMAFPIYTALNSTPNTLITNAALVATIALAVGAIAVTGRLVADRGPLPLTPAGLAARSSAPAKETTAA